LEKPFVLLADDNDATCTLISALLRNDFTCEVAHDGREAISRLRQRRYAVVILDLALPVADGFAVLEALRSEQPDLLRRVLVVTAPPSRRDLARVRKYAVAGVLPKPFEVDVLVGVVRELADGGEGQRSPGGPLLSGGMLLVLADLLQARLIT
jgi:DNA-binding response OmpR family regulator